MALTDQATVCITGSCTVVEILATMNVTNSLCGVKPGLDDSWFVPDIVLLCLMLIVVIMRFIARATADIPFWWDDWMNFVAMGFCIGLNVTSFHGLKPHGYGKDIWAVQPENITQFLKSFYVANLMYMGARCFTRISIILFYLRIFNVKEARRRIVYTLIAESMVSLSYVLTILFQCTPISLSWNKWDLEHSGHCIDLYHFMIVGWSILIASDFWVVWLPLSIVAKLQLSTRKKLLISVMFATGLVVTAVGIAKLPKVYAGTHTMNPTYDLVGMNKYSSIEVALGVICSCMPSLPALFRPLLDQLKGKHNPSMGGRPGYRVHWLRRAFGTEIKTSATKSTTRVIRDILENRDPRTPGDLVPSRRGQAAVYDADTGPWTDQIQAITTINQTYWRNDSRGLTPHESDTELGSTEYRHMRLQAWAYGPGASSYENRC